MAEQISATDLLEIIDHRIRFLAMNIDGTWNGFIVEPTFKKGMWSSGSQKFPIPRFILVEKSLFAGCSLIGRPADYSAKLMWGKNEYISKNK